MDSMINHKNTTPPLGVRGLMVASMLLLAAFQVFWLRKEYNEQKNILQKETDILFQNTIQALEDSVIQNKFKIPLQNSLNEIVSKVMSKSQFNKSQKKLTFSYSRNQNTDITQAKPASAVNYKDTVFRVEGKGAARFQKLARFIQSSKIDTVISPKNTLINVLRKTNPDDIQDVKFNSIGNLDITEVTIADTTPQKKSQVLIVKSHKPSDTLQRLFGKVARVVMLNKSKQDSLPALTINPKNLNDLKVSITLHPSKKAKSSSKIVENQKTKDSVFTFRLDQDSLRIKDIQRAYEGKIQQAKIHLPFHITRQPLNQKPDSSSKQALITAPVTTTMPFGSAYTAIFPSYQGYLFKKIIPQSLFSFFLLAITSLAFGAIYRNLQQQRRLTELKDDFISNVTHELKTPIATVSVAIEALQSFGAAQNPQLTKEYLAISKNELNRLTLLVDKVLKMATFEQQGLHLNLETVDLAEVAQQVIGSMKLQFEKYHAQVSCETIGHYFTLNADRIHLTNVVYNLLDNALKYSGEVVPEIKLTLNANESEISLSVADKGIGIAPEYQDKVFDKFFRVPTGDTHNVKGYGLGLNYVASVIKQHNGQIAVQSEIGQGSTFRVTLPKNL
jgi:two-component system, OmpR family, phosphate regulon sensor histidine kinase PhoR